MGNTAVKKQFFEDILVHRNFLYYLCKQYNVEFHATENYLRNNYGGINPPVELTYTIKKTRKKNGKYYSMVVLNIIYSDKTTYSAEFRMNTSEIIGCTVSNAFTL